MANIDGITYKNIPLLGVTGADTYTNCVFLNVGLTGSITLGAGCQLRNVSGSMESIVMTGESCRVDNSNLSVADVSINGATLTQTRMVAKGNALGVPSTINGGQPSRHPHGQLSVETTTGKALITGYPQGLAMPKYLGYGQECAVGLTGVGTYRAEYLSLTLVGDTGKIKVGGSGTVRYVSEGGTVSVSGTYKGCTGVLIGSIEPRTVAGLGSVRGPSGLFSGWLPQGHTGTIRIHYRGTPPLSLLSLGATGSSLSVLGLGSTGRITLEGESLSYVDRYVYPPALMGGVTAYGGVSGVGLSYLSFGVTGVHPEYAAFLITTTSANQSVTIQKLQTKASRSTVIWGDGSVSRGTGSSSFSHTYVTPGSYVLSTNCLYSATSSTTPLFTQGNTYLKKVLQWGGLLSGTSIADYLFQWSYGLTEVADWGTGWSRITSAFYAFQGCISMVSLPPSWEGLGSLANGGSMFESCSSLTSIPSSWSLPSLTSGHYMFQFCSKLVAIPSSWAGLPLLSDGRSMFRGTAITSVPGSWTGLGAITDMGDMFNSCTALVTIPSSWAGLGPLTSAVGMFNTCTSLKAFPSSWVGLEKVVSAHYMFAECASLKTGGTSSVSSLSAVTNCYAFMDGCAKYTGNVTALYNVLSIKCTDTSYYRYAFRNCNSATGYRDLGYYWKY